MSHHIGWSSLTVLFLLWCVTQGQQQNSLKLVTPPDLDRQSAGRLEIYHNGTWGTICDDTFDKNAATVVCRQLGYTGSLFTPHGGSYYGPGGGVIWLDDFSCTGSEAKLTDCLLKPWAVTDCNHNNDAGVDCDPDKETDIPVQITGGTTGLMGRVEIQHQGQWGTVCDDEWDDKDAAVVCKQMGFSNVYAVPMTNSYFTNGSGVPNQPIWLDDVRCTGSENGLGACDHKPWGSSRCQRTENAGVICLPVQSSGTGLKVRLSDGLDQYQGRVELQVFGLWGTVCDDSFDSREATVVCRMLGYSSGQVLGGGMYAGGTGPIWLDDMVCNGTEKSVDNCTHHPWGVNDCSHREDVAVMCQPKQNVTVQIQLAQGSSQFEGRVEVLQGGVWGTVCDNHWDASDAAVVCRMLNLTFGNALPISNASFGQGSGQVLLGNVDCVGTEENLGLCKFPGWTVNQCQHSHDAGVICQADTTNMTAIRLSGGATQSEGRVEVFYNGTWGTVCDDNFGGKEAAVICRSLGYNASGSVAKSRAAYGPGSGPIWLDDLMCRGTETNLNQCGHRGWGRSRCRHDEDASVLCSGGATTGDNVTVRLVGGAISTEGRVEVYYNGSWGTVCDDYWSNMDAQVVCRMLGLPADGALARLKAFFGQGNLYTLLDDVKCDGSEMSLGECTHSPWGQSNCNHGEEAGVVCQAASNVTVRLVNGTSTANGRVEVFYNNTWGTVCDDRFGDTGAKVVCHMLGFERLGSMTVGNAHFGQGSGAVLLDNVKCVGTEDNIAECASNGWFNSLCQHKDDVSVLCSEDVPKLRLAGGPSQFQGRLEMFVEGTWGTICGDHFSNNAATVACRQMGLPFGAAVAVPDAPYGQGTGKIWLDTISCQGNETSLLTCHHNTLGNNDCDHSEDVSVMCRASASNVTAKLVDGTSPTEGRLEVFVNGQWGTVCVDGFSRHDNAAVACRMLGLLTHHPVFFTNVQHGTGTIWLDDVECTGSELSLISCPHRPYGTGDCGHDQDVWISCPPVSSLNASVHLVGGPDSHSGRVEVFHQGKWGTVCDDGWGITEANVICKQLGFGNTLNIPVPNAYYGRGSGDILIDDINCYGNESNIGDCRHDLWGSNNCDHSEDASVMCLPGVQPSPPIQVRLTGGLNKYQGRLEIKYRGVWGTVCDDQFQIPEATVVCRMLGFGTSGIPVLHPGAGRGPIWLDDLACSGTEFSLVNCSSGGWGEHDCDHKDDAGVNCTHPATLDLGVRIAGGTAGEGRVEVMYGGSWGTICDDHWTDAEAQVICRQKGFSTDNATAVSGAPFGPVHGNVVLGSVNCVGTEANINMCNIGSVGSSDCDHSHDVGVRCQQAGTVTTGYNVRLVNGSTATEGRVEVQINGGEWGTVCDDHWDVHDATVVCRMLKLPTNSVYPRGAGYFPAGTGSILLDDMDCRGNETSISLCGHAGVGVSNCDHSQDAGVICGEPMNNSAPVRLIGGMTKYEGRVEVFHSGQWGSVCDDGFTNDHAMVVCRSLGYPVTSAQAYGKAHFGSSSGPIWLDDINCIGDENFLEECSIRGWGNTDCQHSEDVGVICSVPSVKIRLANGGPFAPQGRVEVYMNGTWGTVCSDLWDARDAAVTCAMLGYSRQNAVAVVDERFGRGAGNILLDDVGCLGSEATVLQCPAKTGHEIRCTHARDAGIICQLSSQVTSAGTSHTPMPTPNPAETFVRLVGGTTAYQGRVEVYAFGSWGTVCDTNFDDNDAAVICSMLGFSDFSSGGSIQPQARYGEGTGPVWLDSVACVGSEVSITQCPHSVWGTNGCEHTHDAGVTCSSAQRPDNFLLLTDAVDKKIYRMDGRTYSYVDVPVSSSDSPVAIDYDYVDGRIIWTDAGLKQIRSVTLSGTTEEVVWQLNAVAVPNGIAVDPVTRLIFYTDTGNDVIALMTIDGFAHLPIIKEDLDEPSAIVADSSTGLVYWCDYGQSPKIERASYDGSVRTPLVTKRLVRPTGIAINSDGDELYWCDMGSGTIEKSRLDGRDRVVLSSSVGSQYYGIVYFSDYLFFTERFNQSVSRMNDDGSGITTVGPGGFGRLDDIHYHREGWGQSGTNACTNGRGGCSHICLPNPDNGFYCVCPDGLTLQPDGLSCGITKPCPALFSPKYGSVSPPNCTELEAPVGKYCTVTCRPGFSLTGQSTLQCMSNGQWNNMGAPLICRDTQGPNITCPQNLDVRAPQGYETATVNWTLPVATDNTGEGVSISQSQTPPVNLGDGVYTVTVRAVDVSGISSSCVFRITVTVLTCSDLKPPANGYIDSTTCRSFYGSTCYISCRRGFAPSGRRNVTCDVDSAGAAHWTTSGTTCTAITCPAPPAPLHGRFQSCETPYSYQELCEQSCNPGYTPLSGTTIRRCEEGTWSGEQLVCAKINVTGTDTVTHRQMCTFLVNPTHGTILPSTCVGSDLLPGTRCTLVCDKGYQPLSTNTLTCSSNGEWLPYANALACLSSNALGASPHTSTSVVAGTVTGVIIVALIIVSAIILHLYLKRRSRNEEREVYELQHRTRGINGIENPGYENHSYS